MANLTDKWKRRRGDSGNLMDRPARAFRESAFPWQDGQSQVPGNPVAGRGTGLPGLPGFQAAPASVPTQQSAAPQATGDDDPMNNDQGWQLALAKSGAFQVSGSDGRVGAVFSSGQFKGLTMDQARARWFERNGGGAGGIVPGFKNLIDRPRRSPDEIGSGSPVHDSRWQSSPMRGNRVMPNVDMPGLTREQSSGSRRLAGMPANSQADALARRIGDSPDSNRAASVVERNLAAVKSRMSGDEAPNRSISGANSPSSPSSPAAPNKFKSKRCVNGICS